MEASAWGKKTKSNKWKKNKKQKKKEQTKTSTATNQTSRHKVCGLGEDVDLLKW